jgi:hypothetical protein
MILLHSSATFAENNNCHPEQSEGPMHFFCADPSLDVKTSLTGAAPIDTKTIDKPS